MNWQEIITAILLEEKKPLQRRDIVPKLNRFREKTHVTLSDLHLGLALHQLLHSKRISSIKIEGSPNFYCLTTWLDKAGNLLPEYQIDFNTKQLLKA